MREKIIEQQKKITNCTYKNLSVNQFFYSEPVFEAVRQFCMLACMSGFRPDTAHDYSDIRKDLLNALLEWKERQGLRLIQEGIDKDSDEFLENFSVYSKAYYLAKDMLSTASGLLTH